MRRELLVSLDILSASMSLAELSAALRYEPSAASSHDKGSPRKTPRGDEKWQETTWRLDSDEPKNNPVEVHIARLAKLLPPEDLVAVLPSECKVVITAGVMHDAYAPTLDVPSASIEIINAYRAELELSFYPTDFGKE
ncbi:MAG TPA: DUF4279 domain-containing protein [Candidatus Binataceae bacterium]|nr:DUF4279 domain-containing protein [Candidatus Binataceae bacterium]